MYFNVREKKPLGNVTIIIVFLILLNMVQVSKCHGTLLQGSVNIMFKTILISSALVKKAPFNT